MNSYKADLHIHTVLSPCGDLEMSPVNIIAEAKRKGLGIIGITDHNTTRHCRLISELGEREGIFVMKGAEVTTKEEVHCLAFFDTFDALDRFQAFLDTVLPDIPNNPAIFGYQVQVDESEIIVYEEPRLLINAISASIEETEHKVHSLNGLFIPAHIDRMKNSIYSQLGFFPSGLNADALELSKAADRGRFISEHNEVASCTIIRNSDSHYINTIGTETTTFMLEKPDFNEIMLALRSEGGRTISIR